MEPANHKLQIHCTKVFNPKPIGITHIASRDDHEFIAAVRRLYYKNDKQNLKIRYIEIYHVLSKPVQVHSFVEHEQITGIGWLSQNLLLTVSLEQTINIYSLKLGQRIFSTITDYGPITSMKLSSEQKLLITGTEYGYVASYRIGESCKSLEPINKMVKLNESVAYLDLNITLKQQPQTTSKGQLIPNKPTKRKRIASSDGESENELDEKMATEDEGDDDDHANGEIPKEFLSEYEISIFGASGGDVIAWDYHKKTIIDTVHIGGAGVNVNVLLALSGGEVVVGDSSGTVSVLDTNTFTCRYSTNVLKSGVLCLTKNSSESSLLVSGQDSSIIIMKRDKSNQDEYRLKEKIEAHTNRITSLSYLSKSKFLSGSLEGFLTFYKRGKESFLDRNTIGPNYSDKVKYFNGEMLIQNLKSLEIIKLMKIDRNSSDPAELTNLDPKKVLTIKDKNYIQSSVFNESHIAYSNAQGLYVLGRDSSAGTADLLHADKSLAKCTHLTICGDHLIACQSNNLTVIELNEDHKDDTKCKVVAKHCLRSIVQHVLYLEYMQQLIIVCGPIKNFIYRLGMGNVNESGLNTEQFAIMDKIDLADNIVSFISTALDNKQKFVYIYTTTDKFQDLEVTALGSLKGSKLQKSLFETSSITDLPKESNILGIVSLDDKNWILYDSNCLYKLQISYNLKTSKIVNHNSRYNQIVTMDNQVFGDPQDVALVELSPDDYRAGLPSIEPPTRDLKF